MAIRNDSGTRERVGVLKWLPPNLEEDGGDFLAAVAEVGTLLLTAVFMTRLLQGVAMVAARLPLSLPLSKSASGFNGFGILLGC